MKAKTKTKLTRFVAAASYGTRCFRTWHQHRFKLRGKHYWYLNVLICAQKQISQTTKFPLTNRSLQRPVCKYRNTTSILAKAYLPTVYSSIGSWQYEQFCL